MIEQLSLDVAKKMRAGRITGNTKVELFCHVVIIE